MERASFALHKGHELLRMTNLDTRVQNPKVEFGYRHLKCVATE
jgi:hypothetical protein